MSTAIRYNGELRIEVLVEAQARRIGHTVSTVEARHLSTHWLKRKQS